MGIWVESFAAGSGTVYFYGDWADCFQKKYVESETGERKLSNSQSIKDITVIIVCLCFY